MPGGLPDRPETIHSPLRQLWSRKGNQLNQSQHHPKFRSLQLLFITFQATHLSLTNVKTHINKNALFVIKLRSSENFISTLIYIFDEIILSQNFKNREIYYFYFRLKSDQKVSKKTAKTSLPSIGSNRDFAKGGIRIPNRGNVKKEVKKEIEKGNAPEEEEENSHPVKISQPQKHVFEESSMQMGRLMLSGWTMLAEFCPGNYSKIHTFREDSANLI